MAETVPLTVTFVSWDGTVLKTEQVSYGEAATAPDAPARENYSFTGWDVGFSNVTSDLVVTAQYTSNFKTFVMGENVTGLLNLDTHELVVSGFGNINNFTFDTCLEKIDTDFSKIVKCTIQDGITGVGEYTFSGCTSLTSITIPEGVTVINDCAFDYCTSLANITIPEGVTIIGNCAFIECTSLANITIPEGVISIGESVFSGCTSLTSITIPEGVTSIGFNAFCGCTSLTSIKIPEGVTIIGYGAFGDCTGLMSITIPEGVTRIDSDAFCGCTSLTSITIKNKDTIISDRTDTISDTATIYGYTGSTAETYATKYNRTFISLDIEATYTVTFKDWNGNVLDSQTVQYGSFATAPSVPARTGYTFTGWDKDFSKIIADLVVTTQYAINTYTVIFQDYNGMELKTEIVGYGTAATPPDIPVREGYSFTGWSQLFANVTSDIITVAQYQINSYTVIFKDWNDTELKNETVMYGNSATTPDIPERTGYEFTGWDGSYTNIIKDTILTAQYQILTFEVKFLDWNGNELSSQTINYGSDATAPPDPERTGYEFAGWNTGYVNVTQNLTITAQYEILKFNVTFLNWDSSAIKSQNVDYGSNATAPPDPVREGYFFLGWDKGFSNVTADQTVNATYDYAAQLTLSPSEIRLVQGDTATIEFIIKPDSLADQSVTWTNSNPTVASLDSATGTVIGLANGTTIIMATHNRQQVTASCSIHVVAAGEMSDEYREAIRTNSRGMWDCQVTVDGTVIPKADINNLKLMEMLFASDKISISSVVSSYIEIEFRNTGLKFLNKSLTFKIGMMVKEAFEYVQFGIFYVTDSEGGEEDETITITAYDSVKKTDIPYSSSLTYPATIQAVAQEISTVCGVPLAETDWPEITIGTAIKTETCRDALSVLAQLMGCSVVANRKSQLEFRWLKRTGIIIDASTRYYTFSRKDMDSYIRTVKMVNDNGTFTASSEPTSTGEVNGLDISAINAYGNQTIVDQIMTKIALDYRAGEVDFVGDPSMAVGDVITVKDKAGKSFTFPIMKNTMEYDGGVLNTMEAYTESEEEQEFTSSKKTTEEKLDEVASDVDDIENDLYGELDEETGEYSGGIVDMVMGTTDPETGERVGGMLKCVSCTELPANPDPNTIYLIQGEVTVS